MSGRLTASGTGLPISGDREISFTIYDAADTSLFTVTKTVTVNEGLFSTTIEPNLPFNEDYQLELAVAGETLSPKQKITPAPYALYANRAGELGSGVVTISGSNINTAGDITAAGKVTAASLAAANLAIGASPGVITSTSGALKLATAGDSILFDTGNDGTNEVTIKNDRSASPSLLLHIKASGGQHAYLNVESDSIGGDAALNLKRGSQASSVGVSLATGGNSKWYIASPPNSDDLRIFDAAVALDRIIIDSATGNVGIGTPDPQYLLDVNGSIRATSGKAIYEVTNGRCGTPPLGALATIATCTTIGDCTGQTGTQFWWCDGSCFKPGSGYRTTPDTCQNTIVGRLVAP